MGLQLRPRQATRRKGACTAILQTGLRSYIVQRKLNMGARRINGRKKAKRRRHAETRARADFVGAESGVPKGAEWLSL
jgi:hypothetical protein